MTAMRVNTLLFVSIMLVAIATAATWAHLLEMPAKMSLSRDDYFAVQQIYRGWAWLGIFIFAALGSTVTVTFWTQPTGFVKYGAAAAAACIVLALVVFFSMTYPANQATANWTRMPYEWHTLRRQWEYGHAIEALCYFAALAFLTLAALSRRT